MLYLRKNRCLQAASHYLEVSERSVAVDRYSISRARVFFAYVRPILKGC